MTPAATIAEHQASPLPMRWAGSSSVRMLAIAAAWFWTLLPAGLQTVSVDDDDGESPRVVTVAALPATLPQDRPNSPQPRPLSPTLAAVNGDDRPPTARSHGSTTRDAADDDRESLDLAGLASATPPRGLPTATAAATVGVAAPAIQSPRWPMATRAPPAA